MGKRQVKNESALKEIRLPEERDVWKSNQNDGRRKCNGKVW